MTPVTLYCILLDCESLLKPRSWIHYLKKMYHFGKNIFSLTRLSDRYTMAIAKRRPLVKSSSAKRCKGLIPIYSSTFPVHLMVELIIFTRNVLH